LPIFNFPHSFLSEVKRIKEGKEDLVNLNERRTPPLGKEPKGAEKIELRI
jgi:hypothetical protein